MQKFSADYIFPVSEPPIKNGIVICDNNGFVSDVVDPAKEKYSISDVKYYQGIICPGFINAHCHLELSFLKNKIEKKTGLDNFIKSIEKYRHEKAEIITEAMSEAENEMIENGIVAVGDISNYNYSFKIKKERKLYYHTFIEVFSFDPAKAERAFDRGKDLASYLKQYDNDLKYSITPHAPYSCSEKLFKKLIENAFENNDFLTIHNQENEEENLLFQDKTGKLPQRLKYFGIDIDNWIPPGKRSLEYILGLMDHDIKLQLVHNTVTKKNELKYTIEKNKNLWWCLCPGANLFIENKLPDVNLFQEYVNDRITIGTDSLASNDCLSVLEELKIIQKNFNINLNELIKWATKNGADFLEVNNFFGTLEKGKKPGINLITGLNIEELKLVHHSKVKRLK